MIIETRAILLQSEFNPWINICITVHESENFLKVKNIASFAYDEWFNLDTDECISDYIKRKLDEAECNYEMFLGDFNEDEEEN